MERYTPKLFLEHAHDQDVTAYLIDLFGMYADDPEFIGRMTYTLFMNAMIKIEQHNKKFDKKRVQKEILKYLHDK